MLGSSTSDSLSFSLATKATNFSQPVRKYLQFKLGEKRTQSLAASGDIALLEAKLVTEVITVSTDDILPVPQMFYCILGTYSWRSEMLWIVDLENLLGYPPSLDSDAEKRELLVMVVEDRGQSIGFVVPKIDNLVEYETEQFKLPSSELFSAEVIPFLQGYFTNTNNQIIMSIDAREIFNFFSMKTEFNYSYRS
ncbi:chemotaxis protein CheW [Myxosarcina sp. GI1]|uniref:chemotaxis protein CheW n=1 Tax=Myxosarcina sp. GI1 TaxID=1541065 RepID=UPI00055DFF8F|nr:chemotaxis protein CheW [Myxosarcina sp. GI1]